MKNSYYQTPRRSEDCTYHSWADPIHRDDLQPSSNPDWIVMLAVAFAAGALIALAFGGLL